MLKNIEEISKEELRSLIDFSRSLVIKEQEKADYEEEIALKKISISLDENIIIRDWTQIVAYTVPNTDIIRTLKEITWIYRDINSVDETIGIDSSYFIWKKVSDYLWVNQSTGQSQLDPDESWGILNLPRGELFIDPIRVQILFPILIWYDKTTKELSLAGPAENNFFSNSDREIDEYPPGLGNIIPTPQEYIGAKLRMAVGDYKDVAEYDLLNEAILSFELPSLWEDVRQPYFASDNKGNTVFDEFNKPVVNPLRIVEVRYRGELNNYYRQLVRDYNISPLVSRTAEQFEAIYWPVETLTLTKEDVQYFIVTHSSCIKVFRSAIYNEAYKSDVLYYSYCRLYIAWMAIIQFMNNRMKGLGDVDRMNSYEITNILYSSGLYEFDDMPLVYKKRLVKNLEKILSEKGTTQVFRDIIGLFDLDRSFNIWKHYLIKYYPNRNIELRFSRVLQNVNEVYEVVLDTATRIQSETLEDLKDQLLLSGRFRSVTLNGLKLIVKQNNSVESGTLSISITDQLTGTSIEPGVVNTDSIDFGLPEVGFQQVDIDDPHAETQIARSDIANLTSYEEFVSNDPLWETTKEEAKQLPFSIVQTKYFSITSAINSVNYGLSLTLFWAMLKDMQLRGRSGNIQIPTAEYLENVTTMNIFEGFVAALILILWKFGIDDIVPHDESGVSLIIAARIDGSPYPNEGSLLPFSTRVERIADRAEPLSMDLLNEISLKNLELSQKIDDAISDTGKIDTIGTISSLYSGNAEALLSAERNVELRQLWDYKFISKYQTEVFGKFDQYFDWLNSVNSELAYWVKTIDDSKDYVSGITAITTLIELYVDKNLINISKMFGTDDIIMLYIERLIKFFKSYTVDLHKFGSLMLIDREATESIRLINQLEKMMTVRRPVDPSPVWDDEFHFKIKFMRRDSLTVTTRQQRKNDIKKGSVELNSCPQNIQGLAEKVNII
jgi:hypothetical protein